MFRTVVGFGLIFWCSPQAFANSTSENSLLTLCDSFGETSQECQCYLEEVKQVYTPADIKLAGGVARAFMNGEEPEAIATYLLMTRKITVSRANDMYKLGDKHIDRVADKCEDPDQKLTATLKAKRNAMTTRLEDIGSRYRVGPKF